MKFSNGVAINDRVGDAGPAFRAAAAYLGAVGGGTLEVPEGSYLFKTYDPTLLSTDEYVAVALPSNVAFVGDSATLVLWSGLQATLPAGTRVSWIGTRTGTSGQTIRGFTFDSDGYVSTVNPGFISYNIVRSYGSRVVIEDLYVKNAPGRNMIIVGDTGGSITPNPHTIRRVTVINGSQNVPGNTGAIDCSFFYLNGADHIVEDCTFSNDNAPVTNCGGIELHCSNSRVSNNKFTNLFPGVYVGVQGGVTSYNNQVKGNSFTTCTGSVVPNDLSVGLVIADNLFTDGAQGVAQGAIYCDRDNGTGIGGAGIQQGVKIYGNTFKAITDTKVGVQLVGAQDFAITNNFFTGYSNAIDLLNSTTEIKNGLIANNIFGEPVTNAFNAGQVLFDGAVGAWAAKFTDILVTKNIFSSPRGVAAPANIYPVVAVSGATYLNTKFVDNEVITLPDQAAGTGAASIFYARHSVLAAGSGWTIRPDGLIEQWLLVIYNVTVNTDQTFTFPLAFPNACFMVHGTCSGAAATFTTNGFTASAFTMRASATGIAAYIRAIGN